MIALIRRNPKLKFLLKTALHYLKSVSKAYRTKHSIKDEVSIILPTINCIDVGASYYPHPQWEVLRMSPNTNWVAVEPNSQNLFYLKQWSWPSKVKAIETGLSKLGGKQTLYVTNVDSGSSLCEPVIEASMEHRILSKDYFFPFKKVSIDTLTLASVVNELPDTESPITIKLDTQGSEFSILQGLPQSIIESRLICVELENTLLAQPFMKGSSPFYEVFEFFEKSGFELVYLKPIQLNAPLTNKSLSSASVLNECDTAFFLRNDIAKKRNLNFQLAMVGCYVSYSLFGEALDMLRFIVSQKECPVNTRQHCESLIEKIAP
jgi:FkbM family methyltransferase